MKAVRPSGIAAKKPPSKSGRAPRSTGSQGVKEEITADLSKDPRRED